MCLCLSVGRFLCVFDLLSTSYPFCFPCPWSLLLHTTGLCLALCDVLYCWLVFLCFFVCCLPSPVASVCGFCDALCSWGVCVLYQLFVCVIDVEVSVSACLWVDLSMSVDVCLLGSVCESHAFLCLCLCRFLVCYVCLCTVFFLSLDWRIPSSSAAWISSSSLLFVSVDFSVCFRSVGLSDCCWGLQCFPSARVVICCRSFVCVYFVFCHVLLSYTGLHLCSVFLYMVTCDCMRVHVHLFLFAPLLQHMEGIIPLCFLFAVPISISVFLQVLSQ